MSARSDHAPLTRDEPTNPGSTPHADVLRYSDAEVHFVWHFIQGSVMYTETRWRLRRHWGLCERHSFALLAIELAFRPTYLLDQAILYSNLMRRAQIALSPRGLFQARRVA